MPMGSDNLKSPILRLKNPLIFVIKKSSYLKNPSKDKKISSL